MRRRREVRKQTGWVGGTTASRRHHRRCELLEASKGDANAYEVVVYSRKCGETSKNLVLYSQYLWEISFNWKSPDILKYALWNIIDSCWTRGNKCGDLRRKDEPLVLTRLAWTAHIRLVGGYINPSCGTCWRSKKLQMKLFLFFSWFRIRLF